MDEIREDPFKEYIQEKEPTKKKLGYSWFIAIGLQNVDGLQTSDYLNATAQSNINGEITLEDANRMIETYYAENSDSKADSYKEADLVSARIAAILSENSFTFSVPQYIGIHKRLFSGIYKHAGKLRDYNISKKEWVLDGASVIYGNALELKDMLEYDINSERHFNYALYDIPDMIPHLADFISRLWQIHAFAEGNTRTTAVFLLKYLQTMGFDVNNDTFARNAWYFRNMAQVMIQNVKQIHWIY
ncbi:MAG: Fic family protein [Solobacterium sp.]|nr:Fic family protein [Solobacterium sp.]